MLLLVIFYLLFYQFVFIPVAEAHLLKKTSYFYLLFYQFVFIPVAEAHLFKKNYFFLSAFLNEMLNLIFCEKIKRK